jgi:lipopolysaccharide/colanic/teichoic acid biosynthesis glycosyltransferase
VIALFVIFGLLCVWVAKQVLASLIGQQVRGSIPDVTNAMARRAACSLPPELADSYEEDWLAELDALERKPLSAIRFARGLSGAARTIRAEAGSSAPSLSYATISRAFEINFSLAFLILISPLLVVIGLAIKLDARGPVFFRKLRTGRDGTPFLLLGFRTLDVDPAARNPSMINLSTTDRFSFELPARTRMGRFLDRSALVSLPAFVNLLRGELALVSPPPQRAGADETLSVRPGILSWQRLVEIGGCDIKVVEARRRDRARGFRSDIRLLATIFRAELHGRFRF